MPRSFTHSHNLVVSGDWTSSLVLPLSFSALLALAAWTISTVKTPPVVGIRATSPRDVEKVERSSWAN